MPHQCIDPIIVASQVLTACKVFQGNTHPVDSLVISVTQIHAGDIIILFLIQLRCMGQYALF